MKASDQTIKTAAIHYEIESWWAQRQLELLARIQKAQDTVWQLRLEVRLKEKGPLKP